jgi:hypothetical protein
LGFDGAAATVNPEKLSAIPVKHPFYRFGRIDFAVGRKSVIL